MNLRCWPCILDHVHPGGAHDWAGPDDIAHARIEGKPSPAGQPCVCDCTTAVLSIGPQPHRLHWPHLPHPHLPHLHRPHG